MSQSSNMALRGQKTISKEQLLALKQEMNAKALTKRRIRTGGRLVVNIVFAILIIVVPVVCAMSQMKNLNIIDSIRDENM